MTAKKTLHLANPYGFSPQQRGGPLHELVQTRRGVGSFKQLSPTEQAQVLGRAIAAVSRACRITSLKPLLEKHFNS